MYSGCAKLLSECTTRDGWTGAAMGVYHILTNTADCRQNRGALAGRGSCINSRLSAATGHVRSPVAARIIYGYDSWVILA